METYNSRLFSPSGHLTHEALLRYHSHGMGREDQYAVEKHVAGCSLCSEALEGADKIRKEEQLRLVLTELRMAVRKRIKIPRPVTALNQYFMVAVIVFLILFLIIVYLVFFKGGLVK